jgi:hypothetical protein
MKRNGLRVILVAAAVLSWAGGCCSNGDRVAPFVAVREAQFRTEQSQSDRIKLPLGQADRDRLVKYLLAGGNMRTAWQGPVAPGADKAYAPLLDWLAADHPLDDLLAARAKYFTTGPVYEVVDAREPSSLLNTQVVAVGDQHYWWIFYHTNSPHLDSLLVTQVIGAAP